MKQWDVFLSHASEDEQTVAMPLTEALRRAGVRVWLDKSQIELGDSLRQKIDQGLAGSRFGVVVLSEVFLKKYWTGSELDALWARDAVLPIWHGIDERTLMKYSPLLAGRRGVSTTAGIAAVAEEVANRVFRFPDLSQEGFPQIARAFAVRLAGSGTVQELVDFVADHPRILMRALGVCIGPKDLFRVAVQLGPNCVDFCTANFQPSMGRLSEYHFVLLGPVDVPVFASDQRGTAFNAAVNRATDIGDWLQSNLAEGRKLLPNVPTTVLTKVVAGRRPQPGSPATKALQDLNDDLIRIQIRTYDWLLDSALAFAEGGDQ